MSESRYNIVFRGELVGGADPAVVKQNLAKVFKMDADRVEKLFTGKAVVLKKDADKATAMKFRAVLKKAGAQCEMQSLDAGGGPADSAQPTSAETGAERASFAARDPETRPFSEQAASAEQQRRTEPEATASAAGSSGGEAKVEEIEAAPPPQAPSAATDSAPPPDSDLVGTIRMGGTGFSGEFDVAPAGADIGEHHEPENAVDPDISHLSMAPPGSDLEQLPADRQVEVPDISHLKLLAPGESEKGKEDS